MDDIKFLNDNEVSKLFGDNSEDSENQTYKEEDEEISSEKVKDLFDDNDDDDDEETEKEENEKPVSKKQSNSETSFDFSGIAKQFSEEGIFNELSEEELSEIKDIDSFKKLVKNAIDNGIDEETKQVRTMLEAGIAPNDINEIKNTIEYLRGITEKQIYDDSDEGFELRRKLILQDFLNQGIDEEDAVDKTKSVFKKGNDMSVASKALENNKQYFKQIKNKLFDDAENAKKEHEANIAKQTESLKTAIFDEDKYMNEISLDEKTKKLVLKNLSDPIYKDKETGQMLTPIQKYERENKTEFLKNLGVLFTITDGFKNMDKVFNSAVKKRVNKEIEDIEDTLRRPSSNESNLKMVAGKKNNLMDNFKFDI